MTLSVDVFYTLYYQSYDPQGSLNWKAFHVKTISLTLFY